MAPVGCLARAGLRVEWLACNVVDISVDSWLAEMVDGAERIRVSQLDHTIGVGMRWTGVGAEGATSLSLIDEHLLDGSW